MKKWFKKILALLVVFAVLFTSNAMVVMADGLKVASRSEVTADGDNEEDDVEEITEYKEEPLEENSEEDVSFDIKKTVEEILEEEKTKNEENFKIDNKNGKSDGEIVNDTSDFVAGPIIEEDLSSEKNSVESIESSESVSTSEVVNSEEISASEKESGEENVITDVVSSEDDSTKESTTSNEVVVTEESIVESSEHSIDFATKSVVEKSVSENNEGVFEENVITASDSEISKNFNKSLLTSLVVATPSIMLGATGNIKYAEFVDGAKFNESIKKLVIKDREVNYETLEGDVTKFVKVSEVVKGDVETVTISTKDSPITIVAWFDKTLSVINWYTEAKEIYLPKDMSRMFSNFTVLIDCDLSECSFTNVETMERTFDGCASLMNVKFSDNKVTAMKNLNAAFRSCKSLVNIDIKNIDLSKVGNVSKIFYNCLNLNKIYVSDNWDFVYSLDASKREDMFTGCSTLKVSYMKNGLEIDSKEIKIDDTTGGDGSSKSYTVKFIIDSHYSSEKVNDLKVEQGETITFPKLDKSKFISTAYTFDKWVYGQNRYNEEESVTKDFCTGIGSDNIVSFVATFVEKKAYTINFQVDSKFSDEIIPSSTVYVGDTVVFPTLKAVDCADFVCWVTDDTEKSTLKYKAGETVKNASFCTGNSGDEMITFVSEFKEKTITINFINEKPLGEEGELVEGDIKIGNNLNAKQASIEVSVLGTTGIKNEQLELDGFKFEGWSLQNNDEASSNSNNKTIDVSVADTEITPSKLGLTGKEKVVNLYSVFKEVAKEKAAPTSSKTSQPIISYSGGGSGGGGGGGVVSSADKGVGPGTNPNAQIYHDGTYENGLLEYNPLTNNFKYFLYDALNNKKTYVVSDWFVISNPKTGSKAYYLTDANGDIVSGWALYNGAFYYLSEDPYIKGVMLTGTITVNGIEYKLDKDGKFIDSIDKFPTVYTTVVNVAAMDITKVASIKDTTISGFVNTEEPESNLINGIEFNKVLKSLAISSDVDKYSIDDEKILSIEITANKISNGKDISIEKDGSVLATYEDGKILIWSKNKMLCLNKDSSFMFSGMTKLTSINLSGFSFKYARDLTGMFKGCSNVESIIFGTPDLTGVLICDYMCDGCKKLTSFDFGISENKVISSMKYMFNDCESLETVDLSSLNSDKLEDSKNAFGSEVKVVILNDDMDKSKVDVAAGKAKTASQSTETLEQIKVEAKAAAEEAEKLDKKTAISFYTKDGSELIKKVEEVYIDDLYVITIEGPTIDYYEFIGWNTDKNATSAICCNGDEITVIKDAKYYAIYTPIYYSLYYYDSKFSCYKTEKVQAGKSATIANYPELTNYQCQGYSSEPFSDNISYQSGNIISEVTTDMNFYPVWKSTQKFISELRIVWHNSYNDCINELIGKGYTPIYTDLNKSAGGDYIYIGYKTTTDPNNAITGIGAITSSDPFLLVPEHRDKNITKNGIGYISVGGFGSTYCADLNKDAGGKYIFLYTTKDKKAGKPITSISIPAYGSSQSAWGLSNSGKRLVCVNLDNNNAQDFNEGCTETYSQKHTKKIGFISIPYWTIETRRDGDYVYIVYDQASDIYEGGRPYPTTRTGSNWMAFLDGNYYLNEINIPGTHDSGTYLMAPTKKKFSNDQSLTIAQQLNAGVRYFDLRYGIDGGTIKLYHGNSAEIYKMLKDKVKVSKKVLDQLGTWITECNCYQKYSLFNKQHLTMDSVLTDFTSFLAKNPTETIIIRSQLETGDWDKCKVAVKNKYQQYINAGIMVTCDKGTPKLEDVRGRIVLDRNDEFGFYEDKSLNYSGESMGWTQKASDRWADLKRWLELCEKQYKIDTDPDVKSNKIFRSGSNCTGDTYNMDLGFISFDTPLPYPKMSADIINPHLESWDYKKGVYYGWFATDFMTTSLAKKIYETNIFLR